MKKISEKCELQYADLQRIRKCHLNMASVEKIKCAIYIDNTSTWRRSLSAYEHIVQYKKHKALWIMKI